MNTLLKNKKSMTLTHDWAEIFFFIVLIIGFLLAVTLRSKTIVYITIFLGGLLAGRLIYDRHEKLSFPYYLIIIGFLIGYLLGVPIGDKRAIVILFVLGGLFSYYIFNKGFLHDLPY